MAADTPGYLSTTAYDSPGEGQSVGFPEWLAATAAAIATASFFTTVKIIKSVLVPSVILGPFILNKVDSIAEGVYHSLANTFATSTEPYARWLIVQRGRTHPFVTGTHAAIVTHDQKIETTHNQYLALEHKFKVAFPPAQKPLTLAEVNAEVKATNARIDKLNKEIAKTNEQVAAINYRLSHGYLHNITQQIDAAQSKAEQHAYAASVTLIHAQDEIYRRRVATIADATGLPAGILHDTIPIALASVVGLEATIAQEITRCLDPMCSDWNLAKDALEGVLGALTTAGAISFLAQAVTDPESFGQSVAGFADGIGNLAITSFYEALGLNPPGTKGLGL